MPAPEEGGPLIAGLAVMTVIRVLVLSLSRRTASDDGGRKGSNNSGEGNKRSDCLAHVLLLTRVGCS